MEFLLFKWITTNEVFLHSESFNFIRGNYFLNSKFFKSLDWLRNFKRLDANEMYELLLRLWHMIVYVECTNQNEFAMETRGSNFHGWTIAQGVD